MRRHLIALTSAFALVSASTLSQAHADSPDATVPAWALRPLKDDVVNFHGVVNFDAAGGKPNAMLYPAPGVAGLLAAVLTHGVIQDSVNTSERQRIRKQADAVLKPYQPTLSALTAKELLTRGMTYVSVGTSHWLLNLPNESPSPSEAKWVVENLPSFYMTQDQQTLVLENSITVFLVGSDKPAYQNVVKVVSPAQQASDLVAYWTDNQGDKLKELSAHMLAWSLDAAIADAHAMGEQGASATSPSKTIRYSEGGVDKFERGQVLNALCDRTVLKTLRGWLMSVPTRQTTSGPSGEGCTTKVAVSQ